MTLVKIKDFSICGGVAANQYINNLLKNFITDKGIAYHQVPMAYCTDNAGWHHFYTGNDIILSIQGDLTGAPAGYPIATVWENSAFYQQGQGPFTVASCLNGYTPGEERFEMERSWNVRVACWESV